MKITSKIKFLTQHYEYFIKAETLKELGRKHWVSEEYFNLKNSFL